MTVSRRARLGALLAGLVVAAAGGQSARADDPTIYIHYTMQCTFSIVGDTGSPVSVIPPGRYQVVVTSPIPFGEIDLSGVADPNLACGHAMSFRLSGPGVDIHTTLEDGDGSGQQFQASFQVGTYVALEDRRPTVTRTLINVVSGAASTGVGTSGGGGGGSTGGSGGGSSSKPAVKTTGDGFRGWLNGNVSFGKPTLKFKGKSVSSLKAGRYTVAIVDESTKTGFVLQRVGKSAVRITPLAFIGRKVRSMTLTPGKWTFFASSKQKSFFTVTA